MVAQSERKHRTLVAEEDRRLIALRKIRRTKNKEKKRKERKRKTFSTSSNYFANRELTKTLRSLSLLPVLCTAEKIKSHQAGDPGTANKVQSNGLSLACTVRCKYCLIALATIRREKLCQTGKRRTGHGPNYNPCPNTSTEVIKSAWHPALNEKPPAVVALLQHCVRWGTQR